jgi:hypothetical protein
MNILKFIACAVFAMSFSTYAQFEGYGGADFTDAFKVEIAAHDQSPVIKSLIAEVEAKYEVTCDGFTTPDYPYIMNHMTFKAKCSGPAGKIKLKIHSKYATTKAGIVFAVRSYSVKVK